MPSRCEAAFTSTIAPAVNKPAPAPPDRSDHLLLELVRQGDRVAVAELYERYASRLQRYVAPKTGGMYDADDVVQSAFRTFIASADSRHYDLPDGQDLWALLVVISLNKLRSRGRYATAQKRAGGSGPVFAEEAGRENDPSGVIDVRDALNRLPPLEREFVELRVAGHPVEDIATRLGKSKRTVERLLRACRQALSALVSGDG